MAFWGIEVKPGKPYTHTSDNACGRLRVSQATLGIGSSNKKSLVQCNVGKRSPVLLCSLLPDKTEYCHLDLEFEEAEEVVFSVIGPRSVHLTGYFLSSNRRHYGTNDSSESYGEDIGDADTEKSNDCSEKDQYEDSFINDGDVEVFSSSPILSSEDEKVMNVKKPKEKKHKRRRHLRKMCHLSDSEDNETVALGNMANGHASLPLVESRAEDQIPISSLIKNGKAIDQGKLEEEKVEDGMVDNLEGQDYHDVDRFHGTNNSGAGDGDLKRGVNLPDNSLVATFDVEGIKVDQKKRKRILIRRSEVKVPKSDSVEQNNVNETTVQLQEAKSDKTEADLSSKNKQLQHEVIDREEDGYVGNGSDETQSGEKKVKKKKRKTKNGNEEMVLMEAQVSLKEKNVNSYIKGTDKDIKQSQAKVLPNKLVVEELQVGKPDGEVACSGRKVTIHYTGKLKEGLHVYDSTIGRDPFKFRLGKGRAIDGLEVGLDGMRVGGTRRLTIPPELGYGSQGIPGSVPPNSSLVLDVELLRVR